MTVKKFIAKFSVMAAAVLLITMFCGITASAYSPKLNKTSVILITGESTTLKVSGNKGSVKWVNSNKKVCKLKSGKLTAVSQGKAVVTAKVDGKTLKCTVYVYDSYISEPSPKALKIKNGGTGKVSFTVRNVENLQVLSYDFAVAEMTSASINDNTLTVVFTGKAPGTAVYTIYDANNPSMSRSIKVQVGNGGNSGNSFDQEIISVNNQKDNTKKTSSGDSIEGVLAIVNEERTSRGLSPLTVDADLCEAADIRVKEIGQSFSHTRPDGRSCFTVLDDLGIKAMAKGENIAWGQHTPEDVMYSWMHSEGHKKNILSKDFTKIGIGYDPSTECWVQLFAA